MEQSDREAALRVASHYIGYAARSRSELQHRLERGGFDAEVVTAVVEECVARGWLDDAALARAWIEDRADRKRYGRTRLDAELRRKGVGPQERASALAEIDDQSELARALNAARQRGLHADRTDAAAVAAEQRRLAGYLQRRGFEWSIIAQVIAQLMEN